LPILMTFDIVSVLSLSITIAYIKAKI